MASTALARDSYKGAAAKTMFLGGLAAAYAIAMGLTIGQGSWPLVAVLAAVPLAFLWPVQLALGPFVMSVPFESGALTQAGSGRTIGWFVGAAAAGILVATAILSGRLRKPPKVAVLWTVFVAWCLMTSLWALDPQISSDRLMTAAACLVLYLAAACLRVREGEFKFIVGAAILAGCIAGLYATYEFYQGMGWRGVRASLMIGGVEVNPNVFATRLLLPLALAVGAYFASSSGARKTFMLAASALLTLAVMLTLSRGALLGVLVMATVFLVRRGIDRRILAVLALFAAIMVFMPARFFSRMDQATATGGDGRVDIWHVGVELLKHYGASGAGLGNFPVAYSQYAGYAPHFRGYFRDPHNIYLAVGVEYGIAGLLLFLYVLRLQLWEGANHGSHVKANIWVVSCQAAGWALMVTSFFDNLLWEKTFWLTWMMLVFSIQLYAGNDSQTAPVPENGLKSVPIKWHLSAK